jgi:hypothetical protein
MCGALKREQAYRDSTSPSEGGQAGRCFVAPKESFMCFMKSTTDKEKVKFFIPDRCFMV